MEIYKYRGFLILKGWHLAYIKFYRHCLKLLWTGMTAIIRCLIWLRGSHAWLASDTNGLFFADNDRG